MAWKVILDTNASIAAGKRIRVRVTLSNVTVITNLTEAQALVNNMTILRVSNMAVLNAPWVPFMPAEIGVEGTLAEATTSGAIGAAVAGNISLGLGDKSTFLGVDEYTSNPVGDLLNAIKEGPNVKTTIGLASLAIIFLAVLYLVIQVKEAV